MTPTKDRFCVSRKGGMHVGRWYLQGANGLAGNWLPCHNTILPPGTIVQHNYVHIQVASVLYRCMHIMYYFQ